MRNVQINFNYIDIPEDGINKLEKSRVFLCKALVSDEYKKVFSGYNKHLEFLRLINGITVNIQAGSAIRNLPFKYNDDTNTVTITMWALVNYDYKTIAGYIAHEISHEWYTHGAGEYGAFSLRLIDLLPQIDVNPGLFKRICNWIKSLFK